MRNRRALAAGLALWLAVVTIGSVLVWSVIGRVGEHLASSEEPLVTPSTAAAVTDVTGSARPGRHPHSSGAPTRSSSPTSAPPATTSSTASSTASTGQSTSAAPPHPGGTSTSRPPSTPSTSSASSPSSPPSPVAQRRTWSGRAGLVTAQCIGPRVSLVAAQPSSGFAVEVDERGPERLVVQFEGRSDGQEGQSVVRAVCVGGAPSFSAVVEGGGGED